MIEQEILNVKDFNTKIYEAFANIVSEIRKTDGKGRVYGGSFYVFLTTDIDNEQKESFQAYTWNELNQRFQEWCDEFVDEYDDVYLQKAVLINPALSCYVKPDEKSGIVLALPYIKLMRIAPHRYQRMMDLIDK